MVKLPLKAKWVRFQHPMGGNWFHWGDTRVCVECHGGLWHISISCLHRYPSWEEIKAAWYDLVPGAGVEFEGAVILPRKEDYVNLHVNCFHVHQLLPSEIRTELVIP